MYDEIFMEGYNDALNEIKDKIFMEGYNDALNEIISNPLPIIGGGDIKGDLLATFGLGNGPERAAAIKNYFDNGGKITGGLFGGEYGTKGGMYYRKNKILPGSSSNYEINDASTYTSLFARLKPEDRKKIMENYAKHKK